MGRRLVIEQPKPECGCGIRYHISWCFVSTQLLAPLEQGEEKQVTGAPVWMARRSKQKEERGIVISDLRTKSAEPAARSGSMTWMKSTKPVRHPSFGKALGLGLSIHVNVSVGGGGLRGQ